MTDELNWTISPDTKRKLFKQAREWGWPKLIAARYANMDQLPDGRNISDIPMREYFPEAAKMNDEFNKNRQKNKIEKAK